MVQKFMNRFAALRGSRDNVKYSNTDHAQSRLSGTEAAKLLDAREKPNCNSYNIRGRAETSRDRYDGNNVTCEDGRHAGTKGRGGHLEDKSCGDTDHYLVHAKVRERLSVSDAATQTLDMEGFNI